MGVGRTATLAVVALSAALLMPTQAHAARSMTGEGGSLSVYVSIDDVSFIGPDCLDVPVAVTFFGSGSLELTAYRPGSSLTTWDYIGLYGDSNEAKSSLQVCPYIHGAGSYIVEGQVESYDGIGTLSEGRFTVSRASASMTQLSATQRGSIVTFKGRVSAVTPRGRIGVNAEVTLRGRLPKALGGTGKWKRIGSASPDQFGRFKVKGSTAQNLRGATIVAEVATSEWATSASSSTIVR